MHVFNLVESFLQTTDRRDSIVVRTFANNENIIVFNSFIIRTFSIETRCKYAKTLISKQCTLHGIFLVILITFDKIYLKHYTVFRNRSLDFMIRIYLPSFKINVLFQSFEKIFKHLGCVFERNIYFILNNFLSNYLPTIKCNIIGLFFRRTVVFSLLLSV